MTRNTICRVLLGSLVALLVVTMILGDDQTKPFSFNKEYTVNQRNAHIHHHDIKIPADATPGEYHLLVYCVDRSGNESMVARTVILSKDAPDDHHHDHE